MSILPTWPIAGIALAIGVALGVTFDRSLMNARIERMQAQHATEERQRQVLRTQDEQRERGREQQIVDSLTRTLQVKENEKTVIADKLAIANARLQDRPARITPAARAASPNPADCKGTTGAELSREDSGFLVSEASRADGIRAALSACYSQYDAVRDTLNREGAAASTPAPARP